MLNTNVQLPSSTSGWMTPQIQPTAEPTKRCSKSRRTSWNSRLRRSPDSAKKRFQGVVQALSNATITEISITCNESIGVDTGLSILLQFEIRQGEVFVRNSPTGPPGNVPMPRIQKGVWPERL